MDSVEVYSKTVKPINFTSEANMSEKFCLKWNDFQTNVSNTFRKLRTSDNFYDVTLVSDDQQQISAHKVQEWNGPNLIFKYIID